MGETEKHKKLKILARIIIKNNGFDNSEIQEEYKVQIGKKYFIVDVCGIKENENIAIECGTTDPEKLINLKLFFDQVIHLPYGITSLESDLREIMDTQSDTINKLTKENEKLKNKILKLESNIKWSKQDTNKRDRIELLIAALYETSSLRSYITNQKIDNGKEEIAKILEKTYPEEPQSNILE